MNFMDEKKVCEAKNAFATLFPMMSGIAEMEDTILPHIFKFKINTENPFYVYFDYISPTKWALLSEELIEIEEDK